MENETKTDQETGEITVIPRNLHQRMLAVTAGAKKQLHDASVESTKINYEYTSHNAVTDLLQPLFVEHGVDTSPAICKIERDVYEVHAYGKVESKNRITIYFDIRFVNVEDPKDIEIMPWAAEAVGNDDKQLGIAVSAGVRQAYQKRFKLRSGDPDIEESDNRNDHEQSIGSKKFTPKIEAKKAPPQKDGVKLILKKDVTEFYGISKDKGWKYPDLLELYSQYGIEGPKEIAKDNYKEIIEKLENGPPEDIPF